ncbi:MAG TPA: TolC family protein [bacterium]|nr:TolC family protein [bacterium]
MIALVRHAAVAMVALSLGAQAFAAPRADAAQPSVAPAPAAPAPLAPAQTYTFAQAVAATLAHNPQIAAAQQTLEAAQQSVLAARAGYGPTLSVNGNGSLGTFGASTSSGVTGAPASSVTGTGTATIAASLPIFDGGKTRVAVESAEAQAASAQAALRQTEQDLALQAGTQFFTVLKDEGLVNVQQQVLTQNQAQLAMTQAKVRAGVAPQSDVIQAEAQVAQAEVALLQARANVLTAKASLAGTMGAETTASIEAASPEAPAARVAVASGQVIATALASRPEIAKANAGVQASQAQLDTAYVNAGPQIGINVGAGYTPVSTSRDLNNTTSYGLTGTISLPLFDSGKGKAEIASAQAGLKSARAQLDAARASVSQDAYQAYLNAVQAAANVTATEAARTAADQALSVAQGRYRAGVGTIIEVITAETTAAQADVNATSAVYDYQSALITLEHAQGAPIVAGVGGGTQ